MYYARHKCTRQITIAPDFYPPASVSTMLHIYQSIYYYLRVCSFVPLPMIIFSLSFCICSCLSVSILEVNCYFHIHNNVLMLLLVTIFYISYVLEKVGVIFYRKFVIMINILLNVVYCYPFLCTCGIFPIVYREVFL